MPAASTLRLPRALAATVAVALLALAAASGARAAVHAEDFEGAFPAWEAGWFGTLSNARNHYCVGAPGCLARNNNPDGLWLNGLPDNSIEVVFDPAFAASLVSLKMDVAGFSPTTLKAYDTHNVEIFSREVDLTYGALQDPGSYASYTITSGAGISRFTFSGVAAGNTSVDNLVATTAVPEPSGLALVLGGLAVLTGMRRHPRMPRWADGMR